MEVKNNDMKSVIDLTTALEETLSISCSKINNINDLLKEISNLGGVQIEDIHSKETTTGISKFEDCPSLSKVDQTEEQEIEKLRKENLQLLLHIQRQQYLNVEMNRTINQNEGVITTLLASLEDHLIEERKATEENRSLPLEEEEDFQRWIDALEQSKVSIAEEVERKILHQTELKEMIDEFDELLINETGRFSELRNTYSRGLFKILQQLKKEVHDN